MAFLILCFALYWYFMLKIDYEEVGPIMGEKEIFMHAYEQSKKEMEEADRLFNYAEDPRFIDLAIVNRFAAETKMDCLTRTLAGKSYLFNEEKISKMIGESSEWRKIIAKLNEM